MPLPAVNCVAVGDEVVDKVVGKRAWDVDVGALEEEEGHFRRRLSWGMWRANVDPLKW